jgi:acyl-CoA synthetase (AMP-forming)/AMP-acid ligase II
MATVPEQIRLVVERWPDGGACRIADGPSMSYGEWEATANRLARSLVDAGVQRGRSGAAGLRRR